MGYLFVEGRRKEQLVAELVAPYEGEEGRVACLAHRLVGQTLWMVLEETAKATGETRRYIRCALLRGERGYGYGCKEISESAHPYYYSCPLKFLEMAPVTSEEWREGVRQYHAAEAKKKAFKKKLAVGMVVKLKGCTIPEVMITSLKPLRGAFGGMSYRLRPGLLVVE